MAGAIQDLSGRFQVDLATANDYFEHTKAIWRLAQELEDQGIAAEFPILHSGEVLTVADLIAPSRTYVTTYLAESVFQHFVSLFEDFLFELLRIWLSAYPAGIPNKDRKPVDLATIIDAPDKQAILDLVIERELNALKYERPSAWFKYLNDRVKLGCPTDEQIERLAEIKASRDVLIHNRGTVNETYLGKAGIHARYKLGQRLDVPEPYLRETWLLMGAIVRDMSAATIARA